MAKNKTVETSDSVNDFIHSVKDETKRKDCLNIIQLARGVTGVSPKMWGSCIVGFGSYHYKYESGREGDMPIVGFSPRAAAIVFYLSANFENRDQLLKKLGKYKTGKGCIYIKKLNDVDVEVLKEMIKNSFKRLQ